MSLRFLKSAKARSLAIGLAVMAPAAAFAGTTGTDFSSLSGAVNYATVITAILAVFAVVAGVDVVMTGGKKVLQAIRKGG